jgi:alpha-beta hydrolase superfamily lysophospholipase
MERFLYIVMALFYAITLHGQENGTHESDTSNVTNNMRQRETYIESKFDSLQISVLEMVPDSKPIAIVYLIHGLCGCKERFLPFMEYLTSNGIACVASDHRGHGNSIRCEEDRGYMYNGGGKAMVMDMDAVVDQIKEHYNDIPLVMLGHSMGSLAARAYTKSHDEKLDALVICGSPAPNPLAPLGRLGISIMGGGSSRLSDGSSGRKRLGFLQKLTSSRYNRHFRHEGYQAWTCSDPQVRKAFAEDPRCNFTLTADCAATLMELFQEAYAKKGWNVARPQMPVIFLSGEDDPCMINSRKFLKSVDKMRQNGYLDVKMHTYPGMRHEILNEIDKQTVWEDIRNHIVAL